MPFAAPSIVVRAALRLGMTLGAAVTVAIGFGLLSATVVSAQGHSIGNGAPSRPRYEYSGKIQQAQYEQWAQLPTPVPPQPDPAVPWPGHSYPGGPPPSAPPRLLPPGPATGGAPPYPPLTPAPPTRSVPSDATSWTPVPQADPRNGSVPNGFPSGGQRYPGYVAPPPPASVDSSPAAQSFSGVPPGGPANVEVTPFPGTAVLPDTSPRYSFRFQNAPWTVVLRQFARDFGMSLDMRQAPPGELNYYDENAYSESQVIDILNDHLLRSGFVLTRNGRKLSLFSSADPIDDGAIPFITLPQLDGLGRNEVASVAFPYELLSEGTITEMRQVMSPLGRVRTLTNSRRVILTDTGDYLRRIRDLLSGTGVGAADIHTVAFRLRNAPAEEAAVAINNVLLSGMAGPVGPAIVQAGGAPPPAMAGPQIVVPEKVTNRLFARGTSEELGVIQRLICEIDAPPPQVFIQALLVEVQLGNTDEFGVEVGLQDSVLFQRSVIDNILTVTETVTSPNGTQTSNQRIVSQTANPGFNFNNQPLGNNITASPSTVGTQGLSNLGVGRINGDLGFGGLVLSAGSESISVLLRALSAKHHIDVLSRPQIRTLDNHEAVIQIGQQVPVVDGVAITGVGSANPVIRQDQAGIILRVMPRIGPDGLVLMDVNAEKSAFQLAPGTGVPIFTDATNGNVIEAPVKDVTSAQTAVGARTGQTIVLGGMITRDNATVENKVPYLGDIPILGHLFRYDRKQSVRKELLIFLTPHILEGPDHEAKLKLDESNKIAMPWHDVTEIHGPIFDDPPLFPETSDATSILGPRDQQATSPDVTPAASADRNAADAAVSRRMQRQGPPVSPTGVVQASHTQDPAATSASGQGTTPGANTVTPPATVVGPKQKPWSTWGRWQSTKKTRAP
ncbi:type II secretion system protein GspD [Planctomyces sp. SH-PL14]|uniref:type II secretion system protein GspD n=1 Tax=Planctomyces sp. SH-PL14 TaxID=1632864 RepID=UPI00078EB1E4|nr:hypothetical protein [Planctomyces sp. SH-PL14]AMV19844.1 Type II secretion system protein D precursor [Planctomyces sp. SH-PL14]